MQMIGPEILRSSLSNDLCPSDLLLEVNVITVLMPWKPVVFPDHYCPRCS
jgi:hypothetical protein